MRFGFAAGNLMKLAHLKSFLQVMSTIGLVAQGTVDAVKTIDKRIGHKRKAAHDAGKVVKKKLIQYNKVKEKVDKVNDPEDYSPLAIHGTLTAKNEDISASTFSYHPGKYPKHTYFNKAFCSHGEITDQCGASYTQTIGKKLCVTSGCWYDEGPWLGDGVTVTGDGYYAPRIMSVDNPTDTSRSPLFPTENSPAVSLYPNNGLFIIEGTKTTYEWVNNNIHPCVLTLYDMQACQDQYTPTLEAIDGGFGDYQFRNLYGHDLVDFAGRAGATSAFASNPGHHDLTYTGVENIRANPIMFGIKEAYKFWKIRNVTQIYLQPGGRHEHTVYHKKNWLYDGRKYFVDTRKAGEAYYAIHAFQTTCLYWEAKGLVSKVISTAITNANCVVYDGVNLSMLATNRMYVKQVLPMQDYFTLDCVAGHYGTGQMQQGGPVGNPLHEVETIEEGNPEKEPGID